jgi:hypothetical protein
MEALKVVNEIIIPLIPLTPAGARTVIQLIAYIKSLSPQTPASQQGAQQRPIVIAPSAAPRGGTARPRQ